MNTDLIHRMIAGAQAGSLALTRSEAEELAQWTHPNAAVIVDGNPVEIRKIPWHLFPDTADELPELDPWRSQIHESLVAGHLDGREQRRLFELADAARDSLERFYDA